MRTNEEIYAVNDIHKVNLEAKKQLVAQQVVADLRERQREVGGVTCQPSRVQL